MSNKKAVKQHYNRILKDPERRRQHFSQGGALGSEREGRTPIYRMHVDNQNAKTQDNLRFNQDEEVSKKLEELKKSGKIRL